MLWSIYPIMKGNTGILLVFHLPSGTPRSIHNKFMKKFYGENTSSWKGRYHYRRRGLLDKIPHIKLYTGVIIVHQKNVPMILQFLRQYSTIIHKRKVMLIKDDMVILFKE